MYIYVYDLYDYNKIWMRHKKSKYKNGSPKYISFISSNLALTLCGMWGGGSLCVLRELPSFVELRLICLCHEEFVDGEESSVGLICSYLKYFRRYSMWWIMLDWEEKTPQTDGILCSLSCRSGGCNKMKIIWPFKPFLTNIHSPYS